MPNENYLKGRNHENYIKRKFEHLGFVCLRSSGSKGAVDVIAIKKGPFCKRKDRCCPLVYAIQCKPKNYKLSKSEREKMEAWSEKTGIKVKVE